MNWFQLDIFFKSLLHFNLRNLAIYAGLIAVGQIPALTLVAGILANVWLLFGVIKFLNQNKIGKGIKKAILLQMLLSQIRR